MNVTLEVVPTAVAHHIRGWYQAWQSRIIYVLDETARYAESVYLGYVNKASGTRMRSRHMEEMFQVDREYPTGEVKARIPFDLDIYLEHPNMNLRRKWDAIANKQEVGGIIRRRKAAILAIHNPRKVSPHTRPRQIRNARWVRISGKPYLVPGTPKRRGPRGEMQPVKARRRKPRKSYQEGPPVWYFVGAPYVILKPKRFWRDTVEQTIRYAGGLMEKVIVREAERV